MDWWKLIGIRHLGIWAFVKWNMLGFKYHEFQILLLKAILVSHVHSVEANTLMFMD